MRKVLSITILGLLPFVFYAQSNAEKATASMEKGLDLYAEKSYQEALSVFLSSERYYSSPDTNLAKLYHRIYACHFHLGELDSTLFYIDKSLFAYTDALGAYNEKILPILANKGYIQGRQGREAEEYNTYLERLSVAKGVYGEHSYEAGVALYDLGRQVSIDMGRISKGIGYYEEGLALMLKAKGESDKMVAWTYENLGLLYGYMGYDEKNLDYCQKAHFIKKKIYKEEDINIGRSYINIGAQLYDLKSYDQSEEHYKKGMEILRNTGNVQHQLMAMGFDGLGLIEKNRKHYTLAIQYALKAIAIHEENLNSDDVFVVESYLNLAEIFAEQGQKEDVLIYLQKALKVAQQYGHRLEPSIYAQIGKWYSQNRDFIQARNAFQLAYYQLGIENLNAREYLEKVDFSKIEHIKDNVELAFENGERLVAEFQSNKQDSLLLKDAYKAYQLADTLLGQLTQRGFGYKPALVQLQKKIHSKIIALSAYGYLKPSAVFGYFEKNKARQLLGSLKKSSLASYLNVSELLLSKESEFKQQIGFFEKKLFEYKRDKASVEQIENTQNQLFDLKDNFQLFQKQLKKEAPKYYNLQYNQSLKEVAVLQQKMDAQSTIIEYFLHEDDLFMIVVEKNKVELFHQSLPEDFHQKIDAFRKIISDWESINIDFEAARASFVDQAHNLFQILLSNVVSNRKNKYLLIIPDGVLSYIPFEILLSNKKNASSFKTLSYLLKEHNLQYAYSCAVYLEQLEKVSSASKPFLAVAPSYNEKFPKTEDQNTMAALERGEYHQLYGAIEEAQQITQLLKGEALLENEASEEAFKSMSNQYRILHLSMHGILEDEDPLYSKLMFAPSKDSIEDSVLHVYELYNMDLDADMAVLSACNTGLGGIQQGEGVISLSHAFSYAGVPSTVMSLWKIPDASSAVLMTAFYEHLKEGKDKDAALSMAKLDYLDQVETEEQSHPYFWASFIVYGNTDPIKIGSADYLWYLLVFSVVFIGFLILKKRRK